LKLRKLRDSPLKQQLRLRENVSKLKRLNAREF
jgi:hypothetical protein